MTKAKVSPQTESNITIRNNQPKPNDENSEVTLKILLISQLQQKRYREALATVDRITERIKIDYRDKDWNKLALEMERVAQFHSLIHEKMEQDEEDESSSDSEEEDEETNSSESSSDGEENQEKLYSEFVSNIRDSIAPANIHDSTEDSCISPDIIPGVVPEFKD